MERERLGSRLGFILLSAGCAIGIGNVWKFPYMVGQNGGGYFVLIYLLFLALLGIPVLVMEFSLGRASQKSPVRIYDKLAKKGTKWHIHGKLCFVGCYLLLMFYTTVAGWMIQYFTKTAAGDFVGANTEQVKTIFSDMQGEPISMIIYMGATVLLACLVCCFGVNKGLEKITKVMMIALLAIMVILAINSIFMKGGAEGLKFYLTPNFDNMKKAGIGNVIVGAMNQSFFTLSLGIGSMAIFGSYIGRERSLLGESVNVAILDTFVAFTSGLIIFPACAAYGVQPDSGPNLIFITLPNIFNDIPLGRLWGSLFFVFMSFAALSTVLAVFELLVSCTMDMTNWNRKKASIVNGVALFLLSIPCVLGFNVWDKVVLFGKNIMDMEDFAVSNVLLPLGSLCFVLFCTTRYGWGWDNLKKEANEGKGLKVADWMKPYFKYVLPLIVLAVFIVGII